MLIFPNCTLYCFNSFVSQTQDHFIPLEGYRSRSPSFSTPFPRSLTALQYSCYKNLASEHSCPILLPTGPIHLLAALAPIAAVLTHLFGATLLSSFKCSHLNFQNSVPGYFSSNSHLLACFLL